ncbi:MAG: hypothetical protein H0A75_08725 [Candidatus Methanofishera endochildressiae]|uniref:Uncharacterized protein n=1 Tax=Candidatus Methanofishera endochildressiae TaxID=2738884 RepID=A0A7Z0MPQ1_9GAMM|nr:hypothetical protein [Candidatus Methanofishera endochildressiae]
MSRLQRSIQAEIASLVVKLKSDPAVADKLARLQAELGLEQQKNKNRVPFLIKNTSKL